MYYCTLPIQIFDENVSKYYLNNRNLHSLLHASNMYKLSVGTNFVKHLICYNRQSQGPKKNPRKVTLSLLPSHKRFGTHKELVNFLFTVTGTCKSNEKREKEREIKKERSMRQLREDKWRAQYPQGEVQLSRVDN